ncbi:hypothetical protein KSP39_PZI001182 [Platanthera zijinensis]|uniref:Uncharacterized protein n=1 Tax=Platanthera zijinensis TaxID=2320716 RepID=A0AAP0GFR1_9ASPA
MKDVATVESTLGMTTRESFQESPTASQIDKSNSLPFSIPSQPLDIKNWFFSYQYESQECSDASHGHEDKKKLFLKVSSEDPPVHPKDENTVESSNFWSSTESSQQEYSLKSDSFTSEGKIDLFFDERPTLESSREKSMVPSGCSRNLKNENSLIITKKNDSDQNRVSSQNGILQLEAFPKHDSLQSKCKQYSHLFGSSYSEQNENIVILQENEFISTKNTKGLAKKNVESSKAVRSVNRKRINRIELQEPTRILGKEQPFLERRALTDQTNVLFAEEANAAEESGKWKCPRKSKPYVGPPFKQLRLERWMRQV